MSELSADDDAAAVGDAVGEVVAADDAEFERLLDYLRRARGFDFTGYKRASLLRRVGRRMATVDIDSFTAYIDYLEVHPDEFVALFNTILINVTSFFRDELIWDYVKRTVIPELVGSKAADDPIRVWSAGCASGAEPYSLAILLAEALGPEAFRDRVKIYATDVDDEALTESRAASYDERGVRGMPAEYLSTWFERLGDRYVFSKDLRRAVIFGRHDLIQDAPISRIDLLVCRNTLIYFNTETQARILNRFNFALNDAGFLLLGKAEMLLAHGGLFVPVDLRRRVFRKAAITIGRPAPVAGGAVSAADTTDVDEMVRRLATETSPIAQIVLDAAGRLVLTNERARLMFDLTANDVGRAFAELDVSYRPVELRRHIDTVHEERRPLRLHDCKWPRRPGTYSYLDIELVPLLDVDASVLGVAVSFVDVSKSHDLQGELEHANAELETAYEELQSTNEELETTNEELQSTVEELETTNEELQSTNEELETMNEELHSTNDELGSINEQLRERTGDLNAVNSYLQSILSSMDSSVIVVDAEMRVRLWNKQTEEMWGLRADEVAGKHLIALDIGLPVETLAQPMRRAIADNTTAEINVRARNRRGREIDCVVRVVPLAAPSPAGLDERAQGAIISIDAAI